MLKRRFGDRLQASSEGFSQSGGEGHWLPPPPAPEFQTLLYPDPHGRLVLGEICGQGPYQGLMIHSAWSPDHPAPVWHVRIEPPEGAETRALYELLLSGGQ
ncbi:MAG: hypothetical protein ABR558_06425 [Thioalkalivibrio sp.]